MNIEAVNNSLANTIELLKEFQSSELLNIENNYNKIVIELNEVREQLRIALDDKANMKRKYDNLKDKFDKLHKERIKIPEYP